MLNHFDIRCIRPQPYVAHVLRTIHSSPQAVSSLEVAILVYGEFEVQRRKNSLAGSVLKMLNTLLELRLVSVHYKKRKGARGRSVVGHYTATSAGRYWLDLYPDVSKTYRPHTPYTQKNCRVRHIPESKLISAETLAQPSSPAPVNLRKYMHRPLPLRVRKAVNMPAHYWR